MGFWSTATASAPPAEASAAYLKYLPEETKAAILADPNAETLLKERRLPEGGVYDERTAFNDEVTAAGGDPDGTMLPWLSRMGNKRIYTEGAFDNPDRWVPGAEAAALKNATYDPKHGVLYNQRDVEKYWIPEKEGFMDRLVPGLIMGAATAGIGAGFSAVLGSALGTSPAVSSALGQGVAGATSSVMAGGSAKDALTRAAAGGLGAVAGTAVANSAPVVGAIGKTGANIAGRTAGALVAGGVSAATGGGSFATVLTNAAAAGIGGAVGAYTGSPVAGALTSGVISTAGKLHNLPDPNEPARVQVPAPTPGSFGSVTGNWGWLTKGNKNV